MERTSFLSVFFAKVGNFSQFQPFHLHVRLQNNFWPDDFPTVLDDDATRAVSSGHTVKTIDLGRGGRRKTACWCDTCGDALILGTGCSNHVEEGGVGMKAGHEGSSKLTGSLDVAVSVIAHNEAVMAIFIATTQYFVLILWYHLGHDQCLGPPQVGVT